MGADKHYLTDVLVGAAAGTLFGVGVPLLLHGRASSDGPTPRSNVSMRMSGVPGGLLLSGQF
jgi:membrane-associated phospholipid phosphatase